MGRLDYSEGIIAVAKHGVELVAKTASRAAAALPVNTDWQVGKFQNQLPETQEDAGIVERTLRKMYYTKINYPRLGMLQDDMKYEKKSYVQDARLRMTEEENQARIFRTLRAHLFIAKQDLLPETQWTPMGADHCYLKGHIHNVICEETERGIIKCATNDFDGLIDRISMSVFRVQHFFAIEAMKKKFSENVVMRKLV